MARAGRVWLHTAAPTNASPAANRTSQGGGAYEAGFAVTAANWSAASSGDVQLDVVCDFGTSDEAVGTVTHWSFDPSPRATTEPTERYRAPPSATATRSRSTPARSRSTAAPPKRAQVRMARVRHQLQQRDGAG